MSRALTLSDVESDLSELSDSESVQIEERSDGENDWSDDEGVADGAVGGEGVAIAVDAQDDETVGESEGAQIGKKKLRLEVRKRRKIKVYRPGPPCECKWKCCEDIPQAKRNLLINLLNGLPDKDAVDSYVTSLIRVRPVVRRRVENPRLTQNVSAEYSIPLLGEADDESMIHVSVCRKAFIGLTGIKDKALRRLVANLAEQGTPAIDKRGTHKSRPNKYPDETIDLIVQHIKSLKARRSHYSLKKSGRFFIPAHLSISVLCEEFNRLFPGHAVDYKKYAEIFNTRFNITIGYPRSDTCSKCDTLDAEIKIEDGRRAALLVEKQTHLTAADKWFALKRQKKSVAKETGGIEVLAFDYQKNLPIPNVSSNDVYYKRQLSLYSFNVHNLRTDAATFFVYDETQGKKGPSNVITMLDRVFGEVVPENQDLWLFADNCGGQNKNVTVFRYLFRLVHTVKKFRRITLSFPVRGHSYMECDRDMANVNQKWLVKRRSSGRKSSGRR